MKRTCASMAADISSYFDGELEKEKIPPLKAHLEGCENCRAKLEGMSRIRTALQALREPGSDSTRSMADRVLASLARNAPGTPISLDHGTLPVSKGEKSAVS
ncbi:MAG: zf-HC2 domain-containing protein [Deltaproteobacteria bacterium]|nr:zf-HC2 domain-containing protein [Deltaproteobacteria bacterium]